MEIKTGMVVWLKSGGPKMTVNCQESPNQWVCQWFDGIHPYKEIYHAEQLTNENPLKNDHLGIYTSNPRRNNYF